MSRTHFTTFERDDGTEVTIEYTISDYDPGVSSGPAEICYPPEGGEVEILSSKVGAEIVDLTDDEIAMIGRDHDFSADAEDDGYAYEAWRDEREDRA